MVRDRERLMGELKERLKRLNQRLKERLRDHAISLSVEDYRNKKSYLDQRLTNIKDIYEHEKSRL